MVFKTKYNNTLAERARIKNGADFVLASGNFIASTAGKGITTGSAIPLGLGVNNTVTAITIDTSSNVGIGLTVPEAKLHVRNGDPGLGTLAQLTIAYSGSTTNYYDGVHVFRNAATVETARITNTGNFGVNEASPDYKLDVNGTFGFTPGSSVTPVDNGDVVFEFTNNTTLTLKAKGSDGVVRSATLVLI
jgi:hypothetical protein